MLRPPSRAGLALSVLVAVLLALPTTAAAKAKPKPATNPIVAACEKDGYQLPGNYSVKALQAALAAIPVAIQEYTGCAQVIETKLQHELIAEHAHASGKGSGGGSGTVILIIVIVVILLGGGGGAFYAYRRNQTPGGPDPA